MNPHGGHTQALIVAVSLALALAVSEPLSAQQAAQRCESLLENRRISLVIPYSPGGGFDAYGRVFAPVLESITGATVRIRHLPGAGALLGISAVANAGPRDLTIGLFSPIVLYNEKILGRDAPAMSTLAMLGSLYADQTLWATREDNDPAFDSTEPRLFALGSNSDFTRVLLPGFAIGWSIQTIRGYGGSTDGLFALLRGDIDYIYSSSVSLVNYVQSTGGIKPLLSISEGPNLLFPDIPYLVGQGSILEQMDNGLSEEQRQERLVIARLASELSKAYRAITITSNADPELLGCLRTMVEQAVFSPELQELAAAQNLIIEPQSADSLQDSIVETGSLIDSNWTLIQKLVEQSRE